MSRAFGASALGSGRARTESWTVTPSGRQLVEPLTKAPVAWRCEHDHRFHPMTEQSHLVYVEDINQNVSIVGEVRARGRHVRRMVVCPPCHRALTNLEASQ